MLQGCCHCSCCPCMQAGALAIQIVSVFWAYQIVSVVRHKAKKRKAAAAAEGSAVVADRKTA